MLGSNHLGEIMVTAIFHRKVRATIQQLRNLPSKRCALFLKAIEEKLKGSFDNERKEVKSARMALSVALAYDGNRDFTQM